MLSTAQLQAMITECSASGGGTVCVPPGEHLIGPIELLDNVNLHLEAGAVLKGSPRMEDYPAQTLGPTRRDCELTGWVEGERAGLITARNADSVSITGHGAIDGNAAAFQAEGIHTAPEDCRPYTRQGARFMAPEYGSDQAPQAHSDPRPGGMIRFYGCRHVQMSGVTVRNSAFWTITLRGCEDVLFTGLSVHSRDGGYRIANDDGINVNTSQDLRIVDCHIHVSDDAIAVQGCERLLVSNCSLSSRSSAIRIGYVNSRPTRDCIFTNLAIYDTNRGIGLFVRGEGSIENLLFSNITMRTRHYLGSWWGMAEPIHISALPFDTLAPHWGEVNGVRFSNILAESENGVVLWGSEESVLRNIILENIRLKIKNSPMNESQGGNFDLQSAHTPELEIFRHDIPAVFARHVRGMTVRDLEIEWEEGLPDYFTYALECEHCEDVVLDRLRVQNAPRHAGGALLSMSPGSSAAGMTRSTLDYPQA